MGTFMDSLAANPAGSGGIYGQVPQTNIQDPLGIMNNIKDREMADFKNKANFMADLSLKQEKMRAMFDPKRLGLEDNQQPGQPGQQGGMHTIMAQDPNQLTGYQKGELDLKQQGIGVDRQRLAQQGRLGTQALDIKQQQERLNQEKSDQINASKEADRERKIAEADAKIKQAQAALESKNNNAAAALQAQKDLAAAMEERHKLEMTMKDDHFKKTQEEHKKTLGVLEQRLKQQGRSKTTTEVNPDGTKRTVTTEKGEAADTVQVIGRDGKPYTIPKDKLDDWNQNHKPEDEDPNQEELEPE